MEAELGAFVQECAGIDATLAEVADDDWSRPALGVWDLAELVAHLVGCASRVEAYLALTPVGDEPTCDRVTYWRGDRPDAEAAAIALRASDRAAALHSPAELPAAFAAAWRRTTDLAGSLDATQLLPTVRGLARLDEYLATRVLEMAVHHVDVRSALDLPATTTPTAGRMVLETLEALLGGPRPRNLGRHRFIQVATGRLPSDDPRFPLLT